VAVIHDPILPSDLLAERNRRRDGHEWHPVLRARPLVLHWVKLARPKTAVRGNEAAKTGARIAYLRVEPPRAVAGGGIPGGFVPSRSGEG
jgi:hypothetical protein